MDWVMWKAVIWGFCIISCIGYILWFSCVVNRTFVKRWHFWAGMIPIGILVIIVVPDIVNFFRKLFDGMKYYVRR